MRLTRALISARPDQVASRPAKPHQRRFPAVVAAAAQFFEDPDQCQVLTSRFGRVRRQQPVELRCPSPQLWPWLRQPLVLEGGLSRPQHLADRVSRKLSAHVRSLIVLPLMRCSRRIRAIVSTICIPDHLLLYQAGSATAQSRGGQFWTPNDTAGNETGRVVSSLTAGAQRWGE